MASIAAILDGIKTRLDTITGFHAYSGLPDSFTPDGGYGSISGRRAGSIDASSQILVFDIVIAVNPVNPRAAKTRLYGYLSDDGSTSVEAALYADPTLGGSVDDILSIEIEPDRALGTVEVNGVAYPGGILKMEVIA
jgi:hypothetical protein